MRHRKNPERLPLGRKGSLFPEMLYSRDPRPALSWGASRLTFFRLANEMASLRRVPA
jgi:hypothetical protein